MHHFPKVRAFEISQVLASRALIILLLCSQSRAQETQSAWVKVVAADGKSELSQTENVVFGQSD
jgi:hypothetical protein